jgi:hypothetical protein
LSYEFISYYGTFLKQSYQSLVELDKKLIAARARSPPQIKILSRRRAAEEMKKKG